ncbi:hypothetical protein IJ425_07860 [bacterium]|nr:hypothetical protein [bacterium]
MNFKNIPKEYYITLLDRLTRFEPANVRCKRVFDDLINKFVIDTKIKDITVEEKIALIEALSNASFGPIDDCYINDILLKLEDAYFEKNIESYQYLSARFNYAALIKELNYETNFPKNVNWLIKIFKNKTNIRKLRQQDALTYPIEKIILCEGQTEFTLLDTIFNLFNINLDKLGIMPIAAGGKNQVARKYYQMIEYTKIPFFILLDKDATSIKELIEAKLRPQDEIYLIKSGEFEDLIPKKILQNTINSVHSSEFNCIFDDFKDNDSMVNNLENIYKKYGFGEFKKAKFALELKQYIEKYGTKDDFSNSEIIEIIKFLK